MVPLGRGHRPAGFFFIVPESLCVKHPAEAEDVSEDVSEDISEDAQLRLSRHGPRRESSPPETVSAPRLEPRSPSSLLLFSSVVVVFLSLSFSPSFLRVSRSRLGVEQRERSRRGLYD